MTVVATRTKQIVVVKVVRVVAVVVQQAVLFRLIKTDDEKAKGQQTSMPASGRRVGSTHLGCDFVTTRTKRQVMEYSDNEQLPSDLQAASVRRDVVANAKSVSFESPTPHRPTRRGFPELSELVLACRHRLIHATLLGAVASVGLAALSWQLIDAPYEAESLVRVRQHQDVVFTPQSSRAEDASFVRAQEQLVLSPQVLASALSHEQVKPLSQEIPAYDAIDWLRNLLRVDMKSGAEVLSISVLHPSPQVSQILCTAVTHAYLEEITNRSNSDRQRKSAELKRAADEADRRLDESWAELNRVAREVGSDNSQSLTIRDEIKLQAYREYAHQLRVAQLRGNELQSLLTEEQLRIANAEKRLDDSTVTPLENHRDVIAARERIAAIDSQIQQMREVIAHDDSPRLTRLYEDRKVIAADLEKLISDLRPQMLDQHRIQLDSSLAQLRKRIELNQAEKEFLHGRMEEIDVTIVRTDDNNGVQLEMSRHAVDRQTRLADALSRSLEEFKIESQSQPRVTLIELATLPSHANHRRQLRATAAAAGVGWLVAIISVGFIEWQSCRVRQGDELRSHTARPVFGANSVSGRLLRKSRNCSASGAQEAAARLMLSNKDSATIPTVIVSSAAASEPRHLVSLDLARAFRAFRRRTLLIDCDTSRPNLSHQLGANHLPGLIQVCPDQIDPRQYIVPSFEEGLDFLPLGLSEGDASWVDPQVFQLTLRSLRADYHSIVVNGPAMMSSAETLLLASHVDQTLLAVFNGTSRWNQLVASEQVAVQAGIGVFGSVLHSEKGSAPLELNSECQGVLRPSLEAEEVTEESLRGSVAEMQQELNQSTSPGSRFANEPAPNRESTT